MSYKYDPVNKILIKIKDRKIVDNYFRPDELNKYSYSQLVQLRDKTYKELKELSKKYNKAVRNNSSDQHVLGISMSGRERAYYELANEVKKREKEGLTKDSKTVDYSYQDASKVFSYLDKEVQRDLASYTKTLQSADTPKKCEELEQIIRDLMEDYMDEYLGIWNQVGQYAQDKRKQTQQLFSTLMAQCFKKYSELKRAEK